MTTTEPGPDRAVLRRRGRRPLPAAAPLRQVPRPPLRPALGLHARRCRPQEAPHGLEDIRAEVSNEWSEPEMAWFPELVPILEPVPEPQNQNRTGSEPVPKKLIIVPFCSIQLKLP